jgi:hypothetical protein
VCYTYPNALAGALRKARLDNIAIVPASLLPQKAQYQTIANSLPQGDILIVFPHAQHPERQLIEQLTTLFRAKGRRVTALQADQVNSATPSGVLPSSTTATANVRSNSRGV